MSKPKQKQTLTGLENPGATCYLNSLMQALFMTPEIRSAVFALKPHEIGLDNTNDSSSADTPTPMKKPKKRAKRVILIELQKLFANLQRRETNSVSTTSLTESFGWRGNEVQDQHDLQELSQLLFDALERSLTGTSQASLIGDLIRGARCFSMECLKCGYKSEREEAFESLLVQVKGYRTVVESLDAEYLDFESFTDENQWLCSKCNKKRDAVRRTRLTKVPPVMIVNANRFTWNLMSGAREKVNTRFLFPPVMNFGKYTGGEVEEPIFYDLSAVIVHRGQAHRGHYFAYINDLMNEGSWEKPKTPAAKKKANDIASGKRKPGSRKQVRSKEMKEAIEIFDEILKKAPKKQLPYNKMGAAFKSLTCRPWKSTYKKSLGSLKDFLGMAYEYYKYERSYGPTGMVTLVPDSDRPKDDTDELEEDTNNGVADEETSEGQPGGEEKNAEGQASVEGQQDGEDQRGEAQTGEGQNGEGQQGGEGQNGESAAESTDKGEDSTEEKEEEPRENIPPEIRWFCFNDRNVKPVERSILTSTYGGGKSTESAYMLIYRQRGFGVDHTTPPALPDFVAKQAAADLAQEVDREAQHELAQNSLEIVVTKLVKDEPPKDFPLTVMLDDRLDDLKRRIEEAVSIEAEAQDLHWVSSRRLRNITDCIETLDRLGMREGETVYVEEKEEDARADEATLGRLEYIRRKNMLEILVENHALAQDAAASTENGDSSGDAAAAAPPKAKWDRYFVPKSCSLGELKSMVLQAMPPDLSAQIIANAGGGCLRNASNGRIFTGENTSVGTCGMSSRSRVIFEAFAAPSTSQIHLMFKVVPMQVPPATILERHDVIFDREETIYSLKSAMAARTGRKGDDTRLRTVAVGGQRGRLVFNEQEKIGALKLRNGDMLYLEPEKLLLKGHSLFEVFFLDRSADTVDDASSSSKKKRRRKKKKKKSSATSANGEEGSEHAANGVSAASPRGEEHDSDKEEQRDSDDDTQTLEGSQSQSSSLPDPEDPPNESPSPPTRGAPSDPSPKPDAQDPPTPTPATDSKSDGSPASDSGAAPSSAKSAPTDPFRFRRKRVAQLEDVQIAETASVHELKLRILSFPRFSHLPSTKHLRLSEYTGAKPGPILKRDNLAIKNLSAVNKLLVEELPKEDPLKEFELMLSICKRNVESKTYTAPQEIFFRKADGFHTLLRLAAKRFGIPEGNVKMALRSGTTWKKLVPPPNVSNKRSRKKKNAKRNAQRQLKTSAFANMKDRDIVGVLDTRDDPEQKDDFRTEYDILHPKTDSKSGNGGVSTRSKYYVDEPALRIEVGDFANEDLMEDDEDGEANGEDASMEEINRMIQELELTDGKEGEVVSN